MRTFGWVVGISLGCVAGVALLWSSASWTPAEKGLATVVWPGGMAPAFLLVTAAGVVCEQTVGEPEACAGFTLPLWLGIPVLIGSVAAPLIVAVLLLGRSSVRRGSSTATSSATP